MICSNRKFALNESINLSHPSTLVDVEGGGVVAQCVTADVEEVGVGRQSEVI